VDEKAKIKELVEEIQAVVSLPIQIDSGNPEAIEAALRVANGVPVINSINGTERSLSSILPLMKKYGGVCVALTMDESGIPDSAEGRVMIAIRILKRANEYGISMDRFLFDPLCLSVSTDRLAYKTTLSAVRMLSKMRLHTTLGVSNISFGMPNREKINSAFFRMALAEGLTAAIINPYSTEMTDAVLDYILARADRDMDEFQKTAEKELIDAIAEADEISKNGVEKLGNTVKKTEEREISLKYAIIKGLSREAGELAKYMASSHSPMDIINKEIIPALDTVGEGYDKKEIYLPSLLMSAEAATCAFDALKPFIPKGETIGGKILLATVKGDIHDIGKNIVRVVLESRGFEVRDLGRDVPTSEVLRELYENEYDLVGLSALMTTTLPAMEETVKAVKENFPKVKVMVGGAVLNAEYADSIGADYYGADAPAAAKIAAAVMANKHD
jgi:5-methyltetrahydrofolate--homocysteine methyltransferase